jgi:hypothetical protein
MILLSFHLVSAQTLLHRPVDSNGEDMKTTSQWQLITQETMTICKTALPGVPSEFAFGCTMY